MDMMQIAFVLVVLVVLVAVFFIFLLVKKNGKLKANIENQQMTNIKVITQLENIKTNLDEKNTLYKKLEEKYINLQDISSEDKQIISQLRTKLSEQQINIKEKLQFFQDSQEKLKEQFSLLALETLEQNSKKLQDQNKQNLEFVLSPVKQQLSDFKKKVEDVYDKETKQRSALQFELQSLKELNEQISTDAINLTNALKGNSKTQGLWGEMVLEKVLESSGLRLGHEYIREESLKDDSGKTYRPDVIVKLPENRDIIIDAKTSLSSYENYLNSDEDQKSGFLNSHLVSINRHIDTLAEKKYEKLQGVNSLDFIFMFVPIESALMIAIENDPAIFDKAFKKKIVLVSPTTLLVALKAIENSWRYEKQAQSTQEIIRLAEKLYAKVRGFVDDLDRVGKHLESSQRAYEDAYGKLYTGKDNMIRQIEVFKEKANINPAKKLPQELVQKATSKSDS